MNLTEPEIKDKLSSLRGWEYTDGQIQKTFSLESFDKAMKLVNQVAMIAESLNHHPDIDIRYNKVTFKLSTHSENGITEKDFALAKKIEQAAVMNL